MSVSALSFSSWHVVSLCPANAVDSTFILFFLSPGDYLQIVVKKPLSSEWRQCLLTFHRAGFDDYDRNSDTAINMFKYAVVQMSIFYRYVTTVYSVQLWSKNSLQVFFSLPRVTLDVHSLDSLTKKTFTFFEWRSRALFYKILSSKWSRTLQNFSRSITFTFWLIASGKVCNLILSPSHVLNRFFVVLPEGWNWH